jgi:hypothetical protein
MTFPLDTASSLLLWSNVVYIVGAVLTLGTSALVLFEKRQIGKGLEVKHSVRNEVFFAASALICLSGTCGAVYFGGVVSNLKDTDLSHFETQSEIDIAASNKVAEQAKQRTEEIARENLDLRQQLQKGLSSIPAAVHAAQPAQRTILNPKGAAKTLMPFSDVLVMIQYDSTNGEAAKLEQQLMDIFAVANVPYGTSMALGVGPASPLAAPGIHILHDDIPHLNQLADSLAAIFIASKIKANQGPSFPPDRMNKQVSAGVNPKGLPVIWVYLGSIGPPD